MSITGIESIVDRLQHSANVQSVFGEPVERGNRTVVPVARVAYGFGGGSRNKEDGGGGSGAGGGGGAWATPVGALELTDEETRFVRFESRKRTAAALLAGVAVGLLVGRRSDRK